MRALDCWYHHVPAQVSHSHSCPAGFQSTKREEIHRAANCPGQSVVAAEPFAALDAFPGIHQFLHRPFLGAARPRSGGGRGARTPRVQTSPARRVCGGCGVEYPGGNRALRGEWAKVQVCEVKKILFAFEAGMLMKTKVGEMAISIIPDEL